MTKPICIIVTNEFGEKDFISLNKSEFKVFYFPMIQTISEDCLVNIDDFEFLIFTSKNGVRYFIDSNNNIDSLKSKKIICLGTKTAELLNEYNLKSYFTSPKNYSKIMLDEVIKRGFVNGRNILLVQGNLASDELFNGFKEVSKVKRINSYRTQINKAKNPELEEILNVYNSYCVFTSPSCFQAFSINYDPCLTNIVSIGSTTTKYIEKKGYEAKMTSKMQTYDALSETVLSYLRLKL